MAKRSGRGETPKRVTKLLENAVKKSNQSAVARDLNIGVAAVNRYLKGIGEPTQETLERLADYFGVSASWLREDEVDMSKETTINRKIAELIQKGVDNEGVRGFARKTGISAALITRYSQGKVGEPTEKTLARLSSYFGVTVNFLRDNNLESENNNMKRYIIHTISKTFEFTGRHLKDKERPNWHYYETSEGKILHFRKENMVCVEEGY